MRGDRPAAASDALVVGVDALPGGAPLGPDWALQAPGDYFGRGGNRVMRDLRAIRRRTLAAPAPMAAS